MKRKGCKFSKVVYQDVSMVKLTTPYIPSFLGFREADIFKEMVTFGNIWLTKLSFTRFLGNSPKSQLLLLKF